MLFYSKPLIYIILVIEVLCLTKFANSFYKVRIESQMALSRRQIMQSSSRHRVDGEP